MEREIEKDESSFFLLVSEYGTIRNVYYLTFVLLQTLLYLQLRLHWKKAKSQCFLL